MSWKVALILDDKRSLRELDALVRLMPVWAVRIQEYMEMAAEVHFSAGDIWTPEPTFTLFQNDGRDARSTCRAILPTLQEHHLGMSAVIVMGISNPDEATDVFTESGFTSGFIEADGSIRFQRSLEGIAELTIDASEWTTSNDFYEAFFRAVGSPAWHGKNFDALRDSIVNGGINEIEAPYRIVVKGRLNKEVSRFLEEVRTLLQKFRTEEGCPVEITRDMK